MTFFISSEVYETEEDDKKAWVEGPVLPDSKARSCAVAVNSNTLAIMVSLASVVLWSLSMVR